MRDRPRERARPGRNETTGDMSSVRSAPPARNRPHDAVRGVPAGQALRPFAIPGASQAVASAIAERAPERAPNNSGGARCAVRVGRGWCWPVLGLAVATAGTATAAKLITGKDIKNGSIARRIFNTAVRAELSEPAKPGPQGPAGPQGLPARPCRQGRDGHGAGAAGAHRRHELQERLGVPRRPRSHRLVLEGLLRRRAPDGRHHRRNGEHRHRQRRGFSTCRRATGRRRSSTSRWSARSRPAGVHAGRRRLRRDLPRLVVLCGGVRRRRVGVRPGRPLLRLARRHHVPRG